MYRDAGHDRCGANLNGNRIRWEMSVGEYVGYKVSNDFLPMLARQRYHLNRTRWRGLACPPPLQSTPRGSGGEQ
jgi:hypothetical protein